MAAHSDATWFAVRDTALLLVPVGSLEQHGPHLPLDTDTTIAVAVAIGVADRLQEQDVSCWVAPPVAFGSSGEHQAIAGTVSIGADMLGHALVDLVRAARTWAERVVFINAHGGNALALTWAVNQLCIEGQDAHWHPCPTEDVDLHAGRAETSLMLHLRPTSVHQELTELGELGPLAENMPLMVSDGGAAASSNGVLGDPTGANAAEGNRLLSEMIEDITFAVLAPDGVALG